MGISIVYFEKNIFKYVCGKCYDGFFFKINIIIFWYKYKFSFVWVMIFVDIWSCDCNCYVYFVGSFIFMYRLKIFGGDIYWFIIGFV